MNEYEDEAIESLSKVILEELKCNPNTIFVINSYHIGKEKIYFSVALKLGLKVYVNRNKRGTLNLLNLPQSWYTILTDQPNQTPIHIGAWGFNIYNQKENIIKNDDNNMTKFYATQSNNQNNEASEQQLFRFSGVPRKIVIRPTGWSFTKKGIQKYTNKQGQLIYGIPYSEHSSYNDLVDCLQTLQPNKVIPTVNAQTLGEFQKVMSKFCGKVYMSWDKQRLDGYFQQDQKKQQHINQEFEQFKFNAGAFKQQEAIIKDNQQNQVEDPQNYNEFDKDFKMEECNDFFNDDFCQFDQECKLNQINKQEQSFQSNEDNLSQRSDNKDINEIHALQGRDLKDNVNQDRLQNECNEQDNDQDTILLIDQDDQPTKATIFNNQEIQQNMSNKNVSNLQNNNEIKDFENIQKIDQKFYRQQYSNKDFSQQFDFQYNLIKNQPKADKFDFQDPKSNYQLALQNMHHQNNAQQKQKGQQETYSSQQQQYKQAETQRKSQKQNTGNKRQKYDLDEKDQRELREKQLRQQELQNIQRIQQNQLKDKQMQDDKFMQVLLENIIKQARCNGQNDKGPQNLQDPIQNNQIISNYNLQYSDPSSQLPQQNPPQNSIFNIQSPENQFRGNTYREQSDNENLRFIINNFNSSKSDKLIDKQNNDEADQQIQEQQPQQNKSDLEISLCKNYAQDPFKPQSSLSQGLASHEWQQYQQNQQSEQVEGFYQQYQQHDLDQSFHFDSCNLNDQLDNQPYNDQGNNDHPEELQQYVYDDNDYDNQDFDDCVKSMYRDKSNNLPALNNQLNFNGDTNTNYTQNQLNDDNHQIISGKYKDSKQNIDIIAQVQESKQNTEYQQQQNSSRRSEDNQVQDLKFIQSQVSIEDVKESQHLQSSQEYKNYNFPQQVDIRNQTSQPQAQQQFLTDDINSENIQSQNSTQVEQNSSLLQSDKIQQLQKTPKNLANPPSDEIDNDTHIELDLESSENQQSEEILRQQSSKQYNQGDSYIHQMPYDESQMTLNQKQFYGQINDCEYIDLSGVDISNQNYFDQSKQLNKHNISIVQQRNASSNRDSLKSNVSITSHKSNALQILMQKRNSADSQQNPRQSKKQKLQ